MTDTAARPPLRLPRSVRSTLGLDAGAVVLAAALTFLAVSVVRALPLELVQDSWLTLVSGREVAQHGLPQHDALAAWTHGARWIDQQWLGQLLYYGLWHAGGMRLVLLTHAALVLATFAIGVRAARALGAPAAAIVLTLLAALATAPWALQMRAQVFGELFFVVLVWLLVADARRPTSRVLLALPLLALWANVHGSVVLGAALVALRALTLVRVRPSRAALLLGGACAAPLATPYGLAIVDYYRSLLLNPVLHRFLDEWQPSAPSVRTAALYVLAAVTIWAVGRYGREAGRFEQAALLVTLLSAVSAVRNTLWFALCALVVLPGLVAPALRGLDFSRFARFVAPLAGAVAVTAVATAAFAATRPAAWYVTQWPHDAGRSVAALAGSGIVLADDRHADWLLWEHPELRGRVAYDVRFELFDERQFERLYEYRNRIGDHWRDAVRGASVVAFAPELEPHVAHALVTRSGFRRVTQERGLLVLAR